MSQPFHWLTGRVTTGDVTSVITRSYGWLQLTHWGRDEMNNISQTTFSNLFSSMKMFEFRLKFHWSLFPRVHFFVVHTLPARPFLPSDGACAVSRLGDFGPLRGKQVWCICFYHMLFRMLLLTYIHFTEVFLCCAQPSCRLATTDLFIRFPRFC